MELWAMQLENGDGVTELAGLAVDARGDVVLAGHVSEDSSNPQLSRNKDALVLKLDSKDGKRLWSRRLGLMGLHDWSSAV
ncbi:unnamed protein product, partial [Choristocarpus tenellus]